VNTSIERLTTLAKSKLERIEPSLLQTGSRLLLAAVAALYLFLWIWNNSGLLFDPLQQGGDARTVLFPFHRYGSEQQLVNDPIADEMLAYVPVLPWLLYRALVPITGVFVAAKIIQGVCFVIIFLAAWWVTVHSRGGLYAGVLLTFLLLRTPLVVGSVAGGFPRSYAFPLLALWIAGALTRTARLRYAAAVIATLTYPPAMLLLIAAEGFYLLSLLRFKPAEFRLRIKSYAAVVAVCGILTLMFTQIQRQHGRPHTLTQAQQEPAFGPEGRLKVLPFHSPAIDIGKYLSSVFDSALIVVTIDAWKLVLVGLLVLLNLYTRPPLLWSSLSLFLGSISIYMVARLLAFRLYSPTRYAQYGLIACAVLITITAVAQFSRSKFFYVDVTIARNIITALVLLSMWMFVGDNMGTIGLINRRDQAQLYDFATTLPRMSLIAAHPMDADDIPLWAGRATTGGFETLQPWLVEPWRRRREFTMRTLQAMYATDRQALLEYCRQERVTHILVNRGRYGSDFRARAQMFEPFGGFLRNYLIKIQLEQLVLRAPPREAIIYDDGRYQIIGVQRLNETWQMGVSNSSAKIDL
jgi:hypothetical protein